jgi:hypothetical protein
VTDEAQAVAAIAHASERVVDLMQGVGAYAKDVVGTVPHDLVGLYVGDPLKIRRAENAQRLLMESQDRLEGIARARLSPPSPSVALPLLAAAVDEERKELRSLWAALLANALVDGGKKVRREFFETLRKMEPSDAVVFQVYDRIGAAQEAGYDRYHQRYMEELSGAGISGQTADVSTEWLQGQNLVSRDMATRVTKYGKEFLRALTVD